MLNFVLLIISISLSIFFLIDITPSVFSIILYKYIVYNNIDNYHCNFYQDFIFIEVVQLSI